MGILAKDEVIHEEAIRTKEEKIAENLRTVETLDVLLHHVDVVDTLKEDHLFTK